MSSGWKGFFKWSVANQPVANKTEDDNRKNDHYTLIDQNITPPPDCSYKSQNLSPNDSEDSIKPQEIQFVYEPKSGASLSRTPSDDSLTAENSMVGSIARTRNRWITEGSIESRMDRLYDKSEGCSKEMFISYIRDLKQCKNVVDLVLTSIENLIERNGHTVDPHLAYYLNEVVCLALAMKMKTASFLLDVGDNPVLEIVNNTTPTASANEYKEDSTEANVTFQISELSNYHNNLAEENLNNDKSCIPKIVCKLSISDTTEEGVASDDDSIAIGYDLSVFGISPFSTPSNRQIEDGVHKGTKCVRESKIIGNTIYNSVKSSLARQTKDFSLLEMPISESLEDKVDCSKSMKAKPDQQKKHMRYRKANGNTSYIKKLSYKKKRRLQLCLEMYPNYGIDLNKLFTEHDERITLTEQDSIESKFDHEFAIKTLFYKPGEAVRDKGRICKFFLGSSTPLDSVNFQTKDSDFRVPSDKSNACDFKEITVDDGLKELFKNKTLKYRLDFYQLAHKIDTTKEPYLCTVCNPIIYLETEFSILSHVYTPEHCKIVHSFFKRMYTVKCLKERLVMHPSSILNDWAYYRDQHKIVCLGSMLYVCTICMTMPPIHSETTLISHINSKEHQTLKEIYKKVFMYLI